MCEFRWKEPGELSNRDLQLVPVERIPEDKVKGYVPTYKFEMRRDRSTDTVGDIYLRVGDTFRLRTYAGHLAYGVRPEFRGHHYAARACRLLLPLARSHAMTELWITCNPDNTASRRTCELAGAVLVEIVDLPEDIDMYQEGERHKCRYRLEL